MHHTAKGHAVPLAHVDQRFMSGRAFPSCNSRILSFVRGSGGRAVLGQRARALAIACWRMPRDSPSMHHTMQSGTVYAATPRGPP